MSILCRSSFLCVICYGVFDICYRSAERTRFGGRSSSAHQQVSYPTYAYHHSNSHEEKEGGGSHMGGGRPRDLSWTKSNPVTASDRSPTDVMPQAAPRKLSRQGSYGKAGLGPAATIVAAASMADMERPQTLELPITPRTPVRSSLKKNSAGSAYQNYSHAHPPPAVANRWSGGSRGGSSGGGTPTNPPTTPPDSFSSDVGVPAGRSDSGFVSTTSRVRFSPSPFEKGNFMATDWSPTHPVGPQHGMGMQQQQPQPSLYTERPAAPESS